MNNTPRVSYTDAVCSGVITTSPGVTVNQPASHYER
jgi:hypothetical protein